MLKSIVCSASLALVIAVPVTALAQDGKGPGACPPGSWFCAQDSQQQAAPAGKPVKGLKPLPDPDSSGGGDSSDSSDGVTYEAAPKAAPPVVVYQPPPPVVVVRPPEAPPPYEYAPPPPSFRERRREWGLNLHLEGAAFGHGTSGDAGMGGGGLGLRFRPTPHFAIESDLDFVGGRDYQGDHRNETTLGFNGLLFLNPRSRAQIYLLGGFGWSWAHVDAGFGSSMYNYFGGQIGAGLELRLNHFLALNADIRGFIRGRTDRLAESQPEFTSGDGRSTNTSGGVIFTGGGTLYF